MNRKRLAKSLNRTSPTRSMVSRRGDSLPGEHDLLHIYFVLYCVVDYCTLNHLWNRCLHPGPHDGSCTEPESGLTPEASISVRIEMWVQTLVCVMRFGHFSQSRLGSWAIQCLDQKLCFSRIALRVLVSGWAPSVVYLGIVHAGVRLVTRSHFRIGISDALIFSLWLPSHTTSSTSSISSKMRSKKPRKGILGLITPHHSNPRFAANTRNSAFVRHTAAWMWRCSQGWLRISILYCREILICNLSNSTVSLLTTQYTSCRISCLSSILKSGCGWCIHRCDVRGSYRLPVGYIVIYFTDLSCRDSFKFDLNSSCPGHTSRYISQNHW